ncbi:MAG TPA: oligosaccharide flippase family protein [Gemmatimonadales bacterium]|jgi:O-antigen/teichoic acid export membrane protein|nr:oligosaccharide flippase family protein [Gemmatimonadales bacterium]
MTGTTEPDQTSPSSHVRWRSQLWWNSAGQLAGTLLARLSRAGGILLAARFLGPATFGIVATGLAAYELLRVATEAGLDTRLIRRVAPSPAGGRQELKRTIGLKTRIALLVVVVAIAAAWITGGRQSSVVTAGLALGVFGLAAAGSVQALATARLEAPRLVPYQAVAGVLFCGGVAGTAILTHSDTLTALAVGLADLVGGGIQLGYAMHPRDTSSAAPPAWSAWEALRESWPVGAVNVMSTAYGRLGVGVLAVSWGATAVAQYGVSYRVVEAFLMAAAAVSASAFAVTARLDAAGSDAGSATALLDHLLGRLALLTLAIAGAIIAGASLLPVALGEQYRGAVATTQVLAFALPPMFLNGILTAHLYGRGRFKTVMRIGIVNLITNAALVALLIPTTGPLGAAFAIVGTESANTMWQSSVAGLGPRAWTWWVAALCFGAGLCMFLVYRA